ncbi:MAG: hypothetical protein H6Q78_1213 [Candidatus Krumholzibacteriota bacterium]|nr:hypothetical protein [Candidatus Krumholzibacteriota bacterium]
MRKLLFALCVALAGSTAHAYEYWNDIRHSALLPGSNVNIRMENPTGAGIENFLLYANGGIIEQSMTPIADGPSTLSGTVPGPVTAARYYGFRLTQGGGLDLMPVRIGNGVTPAPADLTQLSTDPAGDALYGYVNLDLTECRVSFSGERLYAALKNAGGGFPVNSGLTFFGYLLGIVNPTLADPDTVWGMMQTYQQAGVISPGLYRITGTGLGNLTKIGEVQVQEFPATNTLLISCRLADLLADPYFMSWYEPADPVLNVAAFTQRITLLGGAAEADRTPGGNCYLRDLMIAPVPNDLPVLSNGDIQGEGSGAFAEIVYEDANGHAPVLSEIVFDGNQSFPLYPVTLDYASSVVYRSASGIAPLANGTWTTAVFRFSDNETNVVEHAVTATGILDDPDRGTAPRVTVSHAPNPVPETTTIRVRLPEAAHVKIAIYDVRGALVSTLVDGPAAAGEHAFTWGVSDGRSNRAGSGVYFARITVDGAEQVRKIAVVR